jgi:TolB-like protein/class 3 adenylate cyclase/Flp pilus assembly protein TadD
MPIRCWLKEEGLERRLAAILAADVVGYSRLMEADETGTLSALRAILEEIVKPSLETHNGRLVKLMGDGALAEFASVVDAVTSAVAIQTAVAEHEKGASDFRRIQFRIGINLGDIIHEDDDIFGDGVNLAARLEEAAEPGGICVSRVVAEQVAGKTDVVFEAMGALTLKNITEPMEAFRVVRGGAEPVRVPPPTGRSRRKGYTAAAAVAVLIGAVAVWRLLAPGTTGFNAEHALALPTGPTIAVLPFENLSGDPAQDYLADGISEDVIIELGRFRDLNILSRQSTSAYRGKAMDIRKIGAELRADYVLEGSVRQTGERLRVTGRLIDAATGAQIWSEAFGGALTASNLFDVQLSITERVALEVADSDGAVRRVDARRARTKAPEHLSSYECSMFELELFGDSTMQQRIRDCIIRVVEEEPDYWRGWAQLASMLRIDVMLFTNYFEGTHAEKLDRALAAAKRAISLNPDAPRAHYLLASIFLLQGDREGFFAAAEDALALGGDRAVDGQIGYWFVWTGRHDLGAAILRRAIDLNPSSVRERWYRGLAHAHFVKGEYEAALKEFEKHGRPENWWEAVLEVAILTKLGRSQAARVARDRLNILRPGVKIADIVWIYRRFQRPDADTAKYVEAFREAGIPEGKYRPLAISDDD